MSEVIRPVAGAALPEEPTVADAVPSPERLKARIVFALALSQFGIGIPAVSMVLVSWPNTIDVLGPENKALYLSLLTGLFAVVGIIVSPIAGVLSDRSTSRLGMRRPFLLAGAALSLIAAFIMGTAPSITVLILGALVYSAGAAVYAGGNAPLVPDQIPERHRGRVMGLIQVMLVLAGLVTAIVLPMFLGNQFILFLAPGAFMAVSAIVTVLLIKDRHLSKESAQHTAGLRNLLSQFKVNPRKIPDYSWAWIGKAVTTAGTVLTTVYSYFFLTDHLHVPADQLAGILTLTGVVGLFTAIIGAALGSWISDRFRIRKRMVLYTSSFILVGAVVAAFSPSVPVYLVALVIMGLGSGAYFPVDGAVMIDVLPGKGSESGKYMGLMTLADQVPRSIGPFIAAGVLAAGGLISGFGYPAVFIAGGVIAVAGGLLVRKIKGSV